MYFYLGPPKEDIFLTTIIITHIYLLNGVIVYPLFIDFRRTLHIGIIFSSKNLQFHSSGKNSCCGGQWASMSVYLFFYLPVSIVLCSLGPFCKKIWHPLSFSFETQEGFFLPQVVNLTCFFYIWTFSRKAEVPLKIFAINCHSINWRQNRPWWSCGLQRASNLSRHSLEAPVWIPLEAWTNLYGCK